MKKIVAMLLVLAFSVFAKSPEVITGAPGENPHGYHSVLSKIMKQTSRKVKRIIKNRKKSPLQHSVRKAISTVGAKFLIKKMTRGKLSRLKNKIKGK